MRKKKVPDNQEAILSRFGIGEWYGRPFEHLSSRELKNLASKSIGGKLSGLACPFMSTPAGDVPCNKRGGVCTMRLYKLSGATAKASSTGPYVTMCPNRFQEERTVYSWIGDVLLGNDSPLLLGQVGFLKRITEGGRERGQEEDAGDVGRIDNVLVHPDLAPLRWCALEIQAVYFSGDAMASEFHAIRRWGKEGVPFPVGRRRPDFRSSGPKRLMPQLQTKVPTLRRWGKKMAVVVDRSFFDALGPMESVSDVTNSDIAWFVVKYQKKAGRVRLRPDFVKFTELENAVKGLTGGQPATLGEFEQRIREKLEQAQAQ